MHDKETLNKLSLEMNVVLYVYNIAEKSLRYYNGKEEKSATPPTWLSSMAESNTYRKLFQKDGKSIPYYNLPVDDNTRIIFQDDGDSTKLSLYIKASSQGNTTAKEPEKDVVKSNDDIDDLKKELLKSKSEQSKLRIDLQKKETTLQELQSMVSSSDLVGMQRKIKELTEVNGDLYSQIRRLKSDSDHSNVQKLMQVNKELREELNQLQYKSAEAEERSSRMRKALESTLGDLKRLMELTRIEKVDLKTIMSKIPTKELGLGANTVSKPESSHTMGIDDVINALTSAIQANDASSINIDRLLSVVSTSDKESIKRSPAVALKSIVGTVIGMSKASRLTPIQINVLLEAVGVKK